MDSPCAPWHRPVGLFSSKRLSPFVTKRPDAPCPGCRPRCMAGGFLLSFSIAKRKKQRNKLPSEKSSAFCGRRPGGAAPSAPPPPFGKGGRKLYRPYCLRLQASTLAFHEGKAEGRVGRDTGGTPEGETAGAPRLGEHLLGVCFAGFFARGFLGTVLPKGGQADSLPQLPEKTLRSRGGLQNQGNLILGRPQRA